MAPAHDTPFDDLDPWSVLNPEEIADRLGVSARAVRRAISRCELRASKACGLRVLAADAASWWRAGLVAKAPEEARAPQPAKNGAGVPRQAGARRLARAPVERLPLPSRGGSQ